MTTRAFQKTDEGWSLPLEGRSVTQLEIDFRLTLHFWESGSETTSVVIENQFALHGDGRQFLVDPESPSSLAPTLSLLRRKVEYAKAAFDGSLEIRFEGGYTAWIAAHESYESWQVILEGGEMLVCVPGGAISRFPPRGM